MDQVKIGKFIQTVRKESGYTQSQLAQMLNISDKTVSKWECGNGLPEVSLMLPLCDSLKISVNELLLGERITADNYKKEAEKNILAVMKENQDIVKRYSRKEEIGSAISQGIGALLSCAAIPLLIVNAVTNLMKGSQALAVVSMAVCGAAMFIQYLFSTLYHSLTPAGAKKVFGILDHCSIYVLIAGTYTPYCLVALGGALGWTLFGIEWGLAVTGCTFYAIFGSKMRWLSAVTYLPMSWAIAVVWNKLTMTVPSSSSIFLLIGGILYTMGFIFYSLKNVKFNQVIFHLFSLAGTVCHFFSLWFMF
ncbi:hemolysin III family protein [Treponema sp.]|uniref:PAQR family membrane homeostasis protein TrhA n=1 Tax=Treponema sp. TaxID=166 RepID=UPI0025D0AC49|nr:hemolysin III family protein [Treponema sp.]MCR5217434.1 hemolysin III family protein [Treponema sp.]